LQRYALGKTKFSAQKDEQHGTRGDLTSKRRGAAEEATGGTGKLGC
jgi:hypothetical protein